jgi:hypothetical protein
MKTPPHQTPNSNHYETRALILILISILNPEMLILLTTVMNRHSIPAYISNKCT